ncbi:MAG: hypothetical protein M0T71_15840 [Actinomycetota bacterium]|nr:hypothetical protein [Actinomycetota bacterium]
MMRRSLRRPGPGRRTRTSTSGPCPWSAGSWSPPCAGALVLRAPVRTAAELAATGVAHPTV